MSIEGNGDVHFQGYDIGNAPKEFWGRDEYEYWIRVPASEVERLLLLLLKEKYDGNVEAVEDFGAFCKSNDIAHKFSTWNSGC